MMSSDEERHCPSVVVSTSEGHQGCTALLIIISERAVRSIPLACRKNNFGMYFLCTTELYCFMYHVVGLLILMLAYSTNVQ